MEGETKDRFFYLIKDDEMRDMYKEIVGTAMYSNSIAEGIHHQLSPGYQYDQPGGRIIRSDEPKYFELLNGERERLVDKIRRLTRDLSRAEIDLAKVRVGLGEDVVA